MRRVYVKKIVFSDRAPDYIFFWEGEYQTPIFIMSDYRCHELLEEIKEALKDEISQEE